jgi:hypothetical protein
MHKHSTLSLLLLTAALMLLMGLVEAVSAQNPAGAVKPAVTASTTDVTVTVNTLANRDVISPNIYGNVL